MPTDPIVRSALGIDFTPRMIVSTTVDGSPSANAETVICHTAAVPAGVAFQQGADCQAWAAYTVGTSGASVRFRIRQGNGTSGAVVADTGAMTGSQHGAGILSSDDVNGFDTAPVAGGGYCLTMQVGSGAAASTVSAVYLRVIAV